MLVNIQNSIIFVFSEKFATKAMPHYPPHRRCHCTTLRNLKFKIQPFLVTAFTNSI